MASTSSSLSSSSSGSFSGGGISPASGSSPSATGQARSIGLRPRRNSRDIIVPSPSHIQHTATTPLHSNQLHPNPHSFNTNSSNNPNLPNNPSPRTVRGAPPPSTSPSNATINNNNNNSNNNSNNNTPPQSRPGAFRPQQPPPIRQTSAGQNALPTPNGYPNSNSRNPPPLAQNNRPPSHPQLANRPSQKAPNMMGPNSAPVPGPAAADSDAIRRRKMLVHTTTTTVQTTLTEGTAAPDDVLSYYVHVNGKTKSGSSGQNDLESTINTTIVRPGPPTASMHSIQDSESDLDPNDKRQRLSSEGYGASASSPTPASANSAGTNSASRKRKPHHAIVEEGASHLHAHSQPKLHHTSSLIFRLKERLRPYLYTPLSWIGKGDWLIDSKKTDDATEYNGIKRGAATAGGSPLIGSSGHTSRWARFSRQFALTILALAAVGMVVTYFTGSDFILLCLNPLLGFLAPISSLFSSRPSIPPAALPTPYTIISLLHEMNDESLTTPGERHRYIFQFQAVRSWTHLVPSANILVYMDTAQSCEYFNQLIPEFGAIRCFPVPCMHEQFKRPQLDCIFNHANERADTDIVAFVNGDIALSPYLNALLHSAKQQFGSHFTLVSRRTDTKLPEAMLDDFLARKQTDTTLELIQFANDNGSLHSEYGIDLFVYTRTFFHTLNFPAFLAGVYRWDNWLLATLILREGIQVVDGTHHALVVHQESEQKAVAHKDRAGAPHNDALVKSLIGIAYKIGHINNANTKTVGVCPDCVFVPNTNVSLAVHLAKHSHSSHWITVIPVATRDEEYVYQMVCYYRKIHYSTFIFLAKDANIFNVLQAKSLPVAYAAGVPPTDAAADSRNANVDAATSLMQEHEFLMSVLRERYHFIVIQPSSLVLADPIDFVVGLGETVDVATRKASHGVVVTNDAFSSSIYAVKSTSQGQYFWNKVKDCREKGLALEAGQWPDCVVVEYSKKGGKLVKGVFDPMLFPDMTVALGDKWPQENGYYPLVLLGNSTLNIDNYGRFQLLKSWNLMAVKNENSQECHIVTPPHFSPPTTKPETEFSLKIKVITFNRHSSLLRLLTSLNEASYEGDNQIELDISIDYPLNVTEADVLADWQATQLTARSFVWKHGRVVVNQQIEHKGLVGQWTTGWAPKTDKEVIIVLEDDVAVSVDWYRFTKAMIIHYYLNPNNYDPRMYGFALQLQHTILGEQIKQRYGSRKVHELLQPDIHLYRYQLVGTWGGVFFPQHWREFLIWLREKEFQPVTGSSRKGFMPCVPCVLSNSWWAAKPHKVWSQWFIRFAYEKGWYNVYTNFPNQESLVGNFREGGENFNVTKGLMNPIIEKLDDSILNSFPPLQSLPLYDFHFQSISHADLLQSRNVIQSQVDQCWTMEMFMKRKKEREVEAIKQETKQKLKDENKRRASQGLPPLSKLPDPPKPPSSAPATAAAPAAAAPVPAKKAAPIPAQAASDPVPPPPPAPAVAPLPPSEAAPANPTPPATDAEAPIAAAAPLVEAAAQSESQQVEQAPAAEAAEPAEAPKPAEEKKETEE